MLAIAPSPGPGPGTDALRLVVRPLEAASFAPFGQVIESRGHPGHPINGGSCLRFHDVAQPLAHADGHGDGRLAISLFAAQAAPWEQPLEEMERHLLGSQAFVPMGQRLPFLVIVAPAGLAGDALRPKHLQAFVSDGLQGINLAPGTWHHPLRALQEGTWLIVDRVATSSQAPVDCEVVDIRAWQLRCQAGFSSRA
ncbi:ureidoglycolate hydrolase [Corticibacter populi]|uniref:Ureidoglycolate hydrolase n=1 Tax=Corticibacter populi TaxID=1550736 RepID=A0A3M6R0V4_9BURK|nr:ureidoglycolate lyase [Corticibacter populi]RMX08896.1 ureidoglycolate hydrolase [Corticibacter populi]